MYPRTKPEGGGPGLKGIKKDKEGGPGYYKLDYKRVERRSLNFKFGNAENKNFIAKYVKSKENVPGVGRYKEIEAGIKLQTRPVSAGNRRRLT